MSTTKISKTKRMRIFKRDNGECQICHKELKLMTDNPFDADLAQIDHIKPRSLGGGNSDDNLRVLCGKCNASRNNITGEKLVGTVLKSVQIQFKEKYLKRMLTESDLGLIDLKDVELIEQSLIKSFNENLESLHDLKKYIKK